MPSGNIRLEVLDDEDVGFRMPSPPPSSRFLAILKGIFSFLVNNPRLIIFVTVFTYASHRYRDLIHAILVSIAETQPEDWTDIFKYLFVARYWRLLCNIWGSWKYQPSPVPLNPIWGRRDVTVVLPTIDPGNPKFDECILSILDNGPAAILIVTVGAEMRRRCEEVARAYRFRYPATEIGVSAVSHPSKRRQVAHAVPHVRTEFTVLADDHVFWPSRNFVPSALAPFQENPQMGIVATFKRVRRTSPAGEWSVASVLNMFGCFYLQRHNWELRASNAIDGGVFVVSGRTAVYRTRFLQADGLLQRYCNEHFFFGIFGGKAGLGPDDDNYLTREAYTRGWEIKFQETEDCVIETTIGDESINKFGGQLVRWARTTFRSNPCMLLQHHDLTAHRLPYSYLAVYVAGITNFALLWDVALVYSLYRSTWCDGFFFSSQMAKLALWILWSKTVKLWPHYFRHPADLKLIGFQILFGYVHSLIKFWALITFWDCAWLGRNLDAIDAEAEGSRLNAGFTWAEYP